MKRKLGLLLFIGLMSSVSYGQWWKISTPIRLDGTVNTVEAEESMPVFSEDSSLLYFVRTFDPENRGGLMDQDIWYSKRQEDGSYTSCKRLKDLNNKYNNAILGIGENGDVLYLLHAYEGKKDMEKGLAVSQGSGNGWAEPEQINIPTLDIEGSYYGFHVSEDGKSIIISYEGPGTLGMEDLYISNKVGDSWTAPIHMGNTINSEGFEISPFLSKTKDTLFFSSNGFGGYGDADIFYSVKQDGSWTSWSEPVNLGPIVNTPKFDAYFSHSHDEMYWSSNRDGDRSDIYKAYIYYPPPIVCSATRSNVSYCQGEDGSIDLTIEGGVPQFVYNWSNGAITEDVSNLSAGEYTVTVVDSIGQTCTVTQVIEQPECPDVIYPNPKFEHFFAYNKNKLTVKKGKLKKFVKKIDKQLEEGRESITIKVYSSASTVPTRTYKTNEHLTKLRGENMKYDLIDYFNANFPGRVNVVLVEASVNGPEYAKDFKDTEKYAPYQYVKNNTE